jgi:hypothetical protein
MEKDNLRHNLQNGLFGLLKPMSFLPQLKPFLASRGTWRAEGSDQIACVWVQLASKMQESIDQSYYVAASLTVPLHVAFSVIADWFR